MQTDSTTRLSDWPIIVVGILALVLGGLSGMVIMLDVELLILVGLMVGAAIGVSMLFKPELGLLALVFMVYTNLSDVLIQFHGLPSIAKIFIPFLAALVLYRWILYKEKPEGWIPVTILLVLFGLVGIVSMLHAIDVRRSENVFSDFTKNAIVALATFSLVRKGTTFRLVVWTMIGAGAFISFFNVYQFLTGTFDNSYFGFARADASRVVAGSSDVRIAGPFAGSNNFFAQILLLLVPLSLDRFWNEKRLLLRILAAGALALIVLAIIFTFSRGAFLALVAVMAVMLVYRPPKPHIAIATVVAAFALLQFLPATYTERIASLGEILPGGDDGATQYIEDKSFRGRWSEALAAMMMFRDNPLIGVGLGNYEAWYLHYSSQLGLDDRLEDRAAHSLYLEVAAEQGALGIVLKGFTLWFLFISVWRARQIFLSGGLRDYADMTMAYGVGLMGYYMAAVFLHDAFPRFPWMFFGIATALPFAARYEVAKIQEKLTTSEVKAAS